MSGEHHKAYSLSGDTPTGAVDVGQLHGEFLADPVLGPLDAEGVFEGVTTCPSNDDDLLCILIGRALTDAEQEALDALVEAHVPEDP